MLVSTFEVLLKPQFPKDVPLPPGGQDISKLSRALLAYLSKGRDLSS